MAFKVLQLSTEKHKQNQVLHRGVVVPRNLESLGCKYALAPKSDAYLPVVQQEDDKTIKTASSGHNRVFYTPDKLISERGVKRHKTPNSSLVAGNSQTGVV